MTRAGFIWKRAERLFMFVFGGFRALEIQHHKSELPAKFRLYMSINIGLGGYIGKQRDKINHS